MQAKTEEEYERMQAYESGFYHGWHSSGKAQTIDELPEAYKFGPLAVEFAEGYKDGFHAWLQLGKTHAGSKSGNVGVQYRAPKP